MYNTCIYSTWIRSRGKVDEEGLLANASDASVSRKLHTLVVPDVDWFLVACELIQEATLVLVHLGAAGESLFVELELLDRFSFQNKTLVILGKDLNTNDLGSNDKALIARFPNQISEVTTDRQIVLRDFLAAR